MCVSEAEQPESPVARGSGESSRQVYVRFNCFLMRIRSNQKKTLYLEGGYLKEEAMSWPSRRCLLACAC